MPDLSTLMLFAWAALALLIVPGPAVLYIVARSVDQGPKAGVVSTLGISVGTLVHILAAALGVSAILASSELAFYIVKTMGAVYLLYLGLRRLLTKTPPQTMAVKPQALSGIFVQGMIINLLNPKTALFIMAFLPQFVDPAKGHVQMQILILGMVQFALGIVSECLYAVVAGKLGGWLKSHPIYLAFQRYFAGGAFIALGIGALADTGRK